MKAQADARRKQDATTRKARRTVLQPKIAAAQIALTFRHVAPTEALRTYAERKFAHAARHFKRAAQIHVILAVDKYRHLGEVTLHAGHLAATAQVEARELYAVIDRLAERIERQLQSRVGRSEARKVRAPSTGKVMTAAEEREIPQAGIEA